VIDPTEVSWQNWDEFSLYLLETVARDLWQADGARIMYPKSTEIWQTAEERSTEALATVRSATRYAKTMWRTWDEQP
jgi:hypothetical protein